MHLCGNALTAVQERKSAHVPFNMLGTSTKTTITWGWLCNTGNEQPNKIVEIILKFEIIFSLSDLCLTAQYFVRSFIATSSRRSREHLSFAGFTVGNSFWSHHTVALCDRQVLVVVTFLHLPELWPLGSFLNSPCITSLEFLTCSPCAVPPFELHSGGAVVLIIASAIFGHFCLFSLLL